MDANKILLIASIGSSLPIVTTAAKERKTSNNRPNVIVILAGNFGYGDVSANGGTCLTNEHATSTTSTPSSCGLFIGYYPCKNEKVKILSEDAPLIIDENSLTMPKTFQNAGYKTAAIGKWHLELGNGKVDWNKAIKPNLTQGVFDYSCIIAATVDRDVYQDQGAELCGNHNPNGSYRGGKYSLFEGGTLVPFFIYWKDQIFPNKNDALISPLDFYASLGKMIGVAVPKILDSEEHLNVF